MRILLLLCSLLQLNICFAQGYELIKIPTDPYHGVYTMIATPAEYKDSLDKTYPTIIYFHGGGAKGTDGTKLFIEAIPQRIKNGWQPQAINPLTGKLEYFIVIAAQDQWGTPWPSTMTPVMKYLKEVKKLRIDTNRLYTTGLSFGGSGCMLFAGWDSIAPKKVAAVLSCSPTADISLIQPNFKYIAKENFPVWFYCGNQDGSATENATRYSKELNRLADSLGNGPESWVQMYAGGHCCWNDLYNSKVKTNFNGEQIDMYQWFLTNSKKVLPPDTLPTDYQICIGNAQDIKKMIVLLKNGKYVEYDSSALSIPKVQVQLK